MKNANRAGAVRCALFVLLALAGCVFIPSGVAKPKADSQESPAKAVEAPPIAVSAPPAAAPKETPQALPPLDPAAGKKQKNLKTIRSMTKLGDKAVDHLAELSRMGDRDVRLAAVETLSMIESPCALDPLISSLADDDHEVRQAATRALIFRAPLMTRAHVDRLLTIRRNAYKCWPDPAMEGGVIYAAHYAGMVLSKAKSPHIAPEMAQEGDEAVVKY